MFIGWVTPFPYLDWGTIGVTSVLSVRPLILPIFSDLGSTCFGVFGYWMTVQYAEMIAQETISTLLFSLYPNINVAGSGNVAFSFFTVMALYVDWPVFGNSSCYHVRQLSFWLGWPSEGSITPILYDLGIWEFVSIPGTVQGAWCDRQTIKIWDTQTNFIHVYLKYL